MQPSFVIIPFQFNFPFCSAKRHKETHYLPSTELSRLPIPSITVYSSPPLDSSWSRVSPVSCIALINSFPLRLLQIAVTDGTIPTPSLPLKLYSCDVPAVSTVAGRQCPCSDLNPSRTPPQLCCSCHLHHRWDPGRQCPPFSIPSAFNESTMSNFQFLI